MQHHANLLIGTRDWAISKLPNEFQKETNDVVYLTSDSFTITEARSLIQKANLTSSDGGEQVFVIFTQTILREAQNALLKLFEEPNPHMLFFLVIAKPDTLLPTLRSRLHLLDTEIRKTHGTTLSSFIALSLPERLALIESKLKEEDIMWIDELGNDLLEYVQKEKRADITEDVSLFIEYAPHKGSSKKMLLEQIALSL